MVFTISGDSSPPLTGPSSITIPQGGTSGTFTVSVGQVSQDTSLTVTITNPLDNTTASATFTVTQPPIQEQIVASLSNGSPETVQVTTAPITAHFPLGATFTISIQTTQGNPIPATFLVGAASLADGVEQYALFPGLAALQYIVQPDLSSGQFQAVHLGTAPLTVVPNDGTTPRVSLTISVEKPAALGSDHNDFDPGLIALAQSTGVPPQFIKGQIAQEGEFNPFSFRYEPLNLNVGDIAISRDPDFRGIDPFSRFRLPTIGDPLDPGSCKTYPDINLGIPDSNCPGLALGAGFSQHEMDVITGPNQAFHLKTWTRDPSTGNLVLDANGKPIARQLGPNDRYVSASDIFQAGDGIFNWSKQVKDPKSRIAMLTFTGEFPTAGSYGLLQVTYVTAISELNWDGVNPPCDGATDTQDPSGLCDTICNLTNGGGSLGLGTRKVAADFTANFNEIPPLGSHSTLDDDFAVAYQLYNKHKKGYGNKVVNERSQAYPPIGATAIFEGGGQ